MDLVWLYSPMPSAAVGLPPRLHAPNELRLTVYSTNPITHDRDEVLICIWQPLALRAPNATPQIYRVRTRSCDPLETGHVTAQPKATSLNSICTRLSVFQSIEIAQTALHIAHFTGLDLVIHGTWRNGQLRVAQWQPLAWHPHEVAHLLDLDRHIFVG